MSVIDDETRIFQNSIRYLHNISTLPETNVPTLRSFICLKRRLMELRRSSFLPTSATKPSMHCQKCFLNYFEGPATYNVISKPTRYTFEDKVKAKQKNGLPLTRYQEKYLKRMKKFTGNILYGYPHPTAFHRGICDTIVDTHTERNRKKIPQLVKVNSQVTKCKFCNHENQTKLDKPRRKPIPKISLISSPLIKKKKKNKRDKFCGLNQSIVASVSLNNSYVIDKTPDWSKTFIPLGNSINNNTSMATKKKNKNKRDKLYGLNQSVFASSSLNNNHGNHVNQSPPDLSKTFIPLTNSNKNNTGNYMVASTRIQLKGISSKYRPNKKKKKNCKDPKTPEIKKETKSETKISAPLNNGHSNSKLNRLSNKSNKLNTTLIDLTQSPFSKKSIKPEVIDLDSDESFQELRPKIKIKKEKIPVQTSTPLQTPIHKKNSEKYLSKLNEIFKSSGKKNSASTNLMHFLQGL